MSFELMDDVLRSEIEAPTSVGGGNKDGALSDSGSEISSMVYLDSEGNRSGVSSENENWLPTGIRQESEDGSLLLEGDPNLDGLSVKSDASSLCGDNVLGFEVNSETGTPFVDVGNSRSDVELVSDTSGSLSVAVGNGEEVIDGATSSRSSTDAAPLDIGLNGRASRSIFEVSYVPLWGLMSVSGRRPDMEDAVSIIPHFVEIPLQMLVDRPPDGLTSPVTHVTGHFFGVFDGHGGAQVADYCRDRIHSALAEEIEMIVRDLSDGGDRREHREELWTRAFTRCFLRVDDEVGGRGGRAPIARETVGSTAIVAIVCTSHIIVANCGDSRAVLCRGREAVALSVDHKPDREDEYARIEAAGGKVFNWDGCRVSGVLAMSRSIGDRYLKHLVISDPEVTVVPRTRDDECLILASDGLWDEMTNEEACDVARRVLQLWHRNNAATPPSERGEGADPASRAAAEALTHRALQKGSGDNISVVVLDLKRQRRGRSRR
ncbi:protein phosphatase 2C 50-like [Salvia miltiorrhiza]|uniref:protein phosphatase 2C 50-like n=1 Tax=Salvia miltiorrhiza TaxID=226208 RepID=UPI0025ACA230|nr:protein phosphatase 2C 50-like [Salvia miltiorrhiza]XP_057776217.1 protein phosphatase 2C 50-like [Salvia miltiorrhiza]XP_057776218.1 protein phosphatase 2C 50-like [Salvia miltiorrhiza]XP_057776219.1 protein phosphatase 2C 50-like [Salvia miltiorrhiza]XP_057776220.1 protein phosphatase 2C 50-like [Salvia miltiorrhiza]